MGRTTASLRKECWLACRMSDEVTALRHSQLYKYKTHAHTQILMRAQHTRIGTAQGTAQSSLSPLRNLIRLDEYARSFNSKHIFFWRTRSAVVACAMMGRGEENG